MARGYSSITPKGEIAKQYVIEHPKLASRTIARMLRHDHPELFKSIEDARGTVRSYRGNKGEQCREQMKQNRDTFRPNGKAGEVNIPPGISQHKPPLKIKGPLKLLVLSDLHVPYHDDRALKIAIEHGIAEGCEGVYLNGDSIDFYAISKWQKDPKQRNLKNECDTTRIILQELAKHFPKRWYKCGNHDERWDFYLWQRAEELVDFVEFELQGVLGLEEYGYEFIRSKQWAELGKLPILHGHEMMRGLTSPVNMARGLWLKLASTAMCGHGHRSSSHTEPLSFQRKVVQCWSVGCLCQLHPDYAPLNKSNHGHAIVEIASNGQFQVNNYLQDQGEVFRA